MILKKKIDKLYSIFFLSEEIPLQDQTKRFSHNIKLKNFTLHPFTAMNDSNDDTDSPKPKQYTSIQFRCPLCINYDYPNAAHDIVL